LNEISSTWKAAEFTFGVWRSREMPCMLNGMSVQEITERLEEDQGTLTALNAQRFAGPFKKDLEALISTFSDV
jgi:dynein heavy chain